MRREAPDTGRPEASAWSTDHAADAAAAYTAIQAPAWERELTARSSVTGKTDEEA